MGLILLSFSHCPHFTVGVALVITLKVKIQNKVTKDKDK